MQSWTLPELNYAPLRPKLEAFMTELAATFPDEVDFVVLFGSAARQEAGRGSDLDLLIGLTRESSERFLERLERFNDLAPGVEVFPYTPSELALMRQQLHFTLLEAADHGRVLFDRGSWQALANELRSLVESGDVIRIPGGWHRPILLKD
ncbi:MAG: hypothetical protein AMXMBFR33_06730 [Candidatus Xenobia bacterium]